MLELMAQRGRVSVVADQIGSPTSARSVARVLWQFARRSDVYGIHHWTDSGRASWYDVALAIAEEGAALRLVPDNVEVRPISMSEYPTPARRPRYSVLDSASTRSALGLEPIPWRESLRTTLRELADA
jgi:dTDP-4-dehydrorhamnose reductase